MTRSGITQDRLDTLVLLLALAVAWSGLAALAGAQVLTGPLDTLRTLIAMMADPSFSGHLIETGRAFLLALGIAWSAGLLMGLVLGAHRLSGEVFEPVLVALYSIPKIALYPVILLLFGLGMWAKVAFGALHGVIPVALFTMNAVRSLPAQLVRAGRSMRLSPRQLALHVLVPATLPEIVTGFRVGFSLTLLGTLIGEMFASQRGIGHLLIKAMENNDTRTIMALALLLLVFATLSAALLLRLDRRLHRR